MSDHKRKPVSPTESTEVKTGEVHLLTKPKTVIEKAINVIRKEQRDNA